MVRAVLEGVDEEGDDGAVEEDRGLDGRKAEVGEDAADEMLLVNA